jgi:transcription initiation factor IIE alpha subunit
MIDFDNFDDMFTDLIDEKSVRTKIGFLTTECVLRCRICRKINTVKTTTKTLIKRMNQPEKQLSDPFSDIVRRKGGILKSITIPQMNMTKNSVVYICADCLDRLGLEESNAIIYTKFECGKCDKSIVLDLSLKSINLSFDELHLFAEKAMELGWIVSFSIKDNVFFVEALCPDCSPITPVWKRLKLGGHFEE